jgi:lysophospholipase L1-like esterase
VKRFVLPALISITLTLLVLEGAARLITPGADASFSELRAGLPEFFVEDPVTFWALRPGFYSDAPAVVRKWGGAPLSINSHGMRGPQISRAKPAGEKRAIVLGGSHPMGMWVRPGEAYSAVLERRLNQRDGPLWSVLNASVAGYTSHQGLAQLEDLLGFEPDVILCDLGVNDSLPQLAWNVPRPDHLLREPPPALDPLRSLLRTSAAYRWALLRISAAAENTDRGPRVSPDRHVQNLQRIGEVARSGGAKTLYLNQFSARVEPWVPGSTTPECVLDEASLDPVVDVCGLFTARTPDLPDLFADPIHANADGHRLIAGAILERLEGLGWLDGGAEPPP